MNYTLVLFKPGGMGFKKQVLEMIDDTVQKNGLKIIHEAPVKLDLDQGRDLYREHKDAWYHTKLAEQVSSCPLYGVVIEGGEDLIPTIKTLVGATKPEEADKDSIRGKFKVGKNYAECKAEGEVVDNICHTSGNFAEAKWEIGVAFPEFAKTIYEA